MSAIQTWKDELHFVRSLGIQLLALLLVYTLLRVSFLLFNLPLFTPIDSGEVLEVFLNGIRFDVVALAYINLPLILLWLIPFPFRKQRFYFKLSKVLFYLLNVPFLVFALMDQEYFPYSFKRTTLEATGMTGDFFQLLPQFIRDFWYLPLLLAALILLMEWIMRKGMYVKKPVRQTLPVQVLIFLIGAGITVILMRGGLQNRPLTPIDAIRFTRMELVPLVTNTPFTLLHSLEKERVEIPEYFSDQELDQYITLLHPKEYQSPSIIGLDSSKPDNVMVIVLESFSKMYMGLYGAERSATPFLDSLGQHALIFDRAFANGTRSVDGIPAICASIPNLMDRYYMNSTFQDNALDGMGTLLRQEGYHTLFFHGGNPGTFQLESFARLAGFDQYYDRESFGDEAYFDGNWGIYDRPFFQYTADILDQTEKPFGAVLFSLSSHHPFTLPVGYEEKVTHLSEPVLKAIHYTDDALRQFFKRVETQPWFSETLFIITADHHGPGLPGKSNDLIERFGMPLIVYKPGGPSGRFDHVVEQIDILPGIMDYLRFDQPFHSLGSSLFRAGESGYTVRYIHGVYQVNDERFLLQFQNEEPTGLYLYQTDPGQKNNVIKQYPSEAQRLETYLKAYLQRYFQALVNNQLAYRKPS